MSFFRKASKSLEAIDSHVESVTTRHHIAYHFDGLKDENDFSGGDDLDGDYTDDTDDDSESRDDNELSFDHGHANDAEDNSITKDAMDVRIQLFKCSTTNRPTHPCIFHINLNVDLHIIHHKHDALMMQD